MQELTDDQRYAAITARDARFFDGVSFTCVRSTGISCRPSCPSRTPGRDRVEFVPSAAAAVARGRPAGRYRARIRPAEGSITTMPAPLMAGIRHRRIDTPLGTYVLAAGDDALIGVWRQQQKHFPVVSQLGDPAGHTHPVLDAAATQLGQYLAGERADFELPLAAVGTPFQHRVWEQLQRIPFGGTTTYGQIARSVGSPRAAQAVGAAVGSNPLSIVVPCHRVLASNGALTGYAGGVETKLALLRLEGVLAD